MSFLSKAGVVVDMQPEPMELQGSCWGMCGGVWLRTCVIGGFGDGACMSTCRALRNLTGSCQQNSPASKALHLLPKPCICFQSPVSAPSCEPEPMSNPECRTCWWCWWRALPSLDHRYQWWSFSVYFLFMYLFSATGPAAAVWLAVLVSWLAGLALGFRFRQCAEKSFVFLPNEKQGGNKGRKLYT